MYGDSFVGCPGCGASLGDAAVAGARRCGGCNGMWVPEPDATGLMREMTNNAELGALRFVTSSDGFSAHGCPECGRGMMTGTLEAMAVERCPKSHGYWFDASVLEAALFRAGKRTLGQAG